MKSQLQIHEKVSEGRKSKKNHRCNRCHLKFCTSSGLLLHQKKCKGIRKISIINQNKIEENVEAARSKSAQPKNNVHRDEKQKKCNFCDTKFDTEQQLQIHQHFFEGIQYHVPNWKCNQCKFKSCSSLGIEIHKKNMHEKNAENPKPANPNLKVDIHEKEKPKQIVDVHEDEKPKKCTFCDEIFSTTKQLQYHETSFDGKPKKCNGCNFKSCNPIGLKIHEEKIHSCAKEIDKNKQTQSGSKVEKISRSEPTIKINPRVKSPHLEPSMELNISTKKEVVERSKNQTKHVLPKPKKGQWIVKLYRISLPTTFSDE